MDKEAAGWKEAPEFFFNHLFIEQLAGVSVLRRYGAPKIPNDYQGILSRIELYFKRKRGTESRTFGFLKWPILELREPRLQKHPFTIKGGQWS